MASIKTELRTTLGNMEEALNTAGETLQNVTAKLAELKAQIGDDDEFERQRQLKNPSPDFLKYVSIEVWANNFEGLIMMFGSYEQKMRNDIRTKSVEALQSLQNAFYGILDGLTSLMLEYGRRLWTMVMKKARHLMAAASQIWQIIKENPGKLAAFLFGAAVGAAASAHAGFYLGLGIGIHAASGGVGLAAGLVAVGLFYACSCAYKYFQGKVQDYAELKAEVSRLKKTVDDILISDDLSAQVNKTKDDIFHQMDVYESKFLECDDAP